MGGGTGTPTAIDDDARFEPNAASPLPKPPLPAHQVPDLHSVFKSVSADLPGLHASQATIDKLNSTERKILGAAPVTLLLSPSDVLVKNAQGQIDMAASETKLGDVVANFYPGAALGPDQRKSLVTSLKEIAVSPQAENVQMSPGACMVEFNPATGAGSNGISRQITGLPDSYIRPDKLAIMNDLFSKYALAHELGHCKEGTAGNAPQLHTLFVLNASDLMTAEASADNLARVQLNALPSSMMPHKKEELQAILDQRAISGMLVPGTTQGLHENKLLLMTEHATIGPILRPGADPVAALVAPGMANRSIDPFIGGQMLENGIKPQQPEMYQQAVDIKAKNPDQYDAVMHVFGLEATKQSPLLHYAAAKAMLEEGMFAKDSLARLNVEQYVKAMEHNVKPDLLADATGLIEPLRDTLHHMPADEREKLTVTAAKENAEALALLTDPKNRAGLESYFPTEPGKTPNASVPPPGPPPSAN